MSREPQSASASATRWETCDREKGERMLTRMIESGIDFSMDKITEPGSRNDTTERWVFFFPGDQFVNYVASIMYP